MLPQRDLTIWMKKTKTDSLIKLLLHKKQNIIMYDLIIIGAGPAGITAAIYAARKKLNFLVISKNIGGQTLLSPEVENYVGYQYLTGAELMKKFEEHMKTYNIEVKQEEVKNIEKGPLRVITEKETHETKTIIIASGKRYKSLNVPGEKEFLGKGVSYCPTCDAPLFAGKDVVVVGGGNAALTTALQLTKFVNKLYIINISPNLTGDKIMRERLIQTGKVEVFNKSEMLEISGSKFVDAVRIKTGGKEKKLAVQGVFVEIGLVPNVSFAGIVKRNMHDEIMISRSTQMYKENMTSVAGIFAAGDVTDVPEKQIIVAAGEGAKAALAVDDYLSKNKD
jgi:alkyl hydroperoxide reductase subunit F